MLHAKSSPGTKASYLAVQHNKPLVVKVNPAYHNNLTPQIDSAGVPTVSISRAPLQRSLGREPRYEWLDVPLASQTHVFGKLSLDKNGGSLPILSRDFNLIRLILAPLSEALSTSGWFSSTNLPHSLTDGFWKEFSSVNSFDDLADLVTTYLATSFNARNCSLFLAQRPLLPSNLAVTQPDQLVLWSTTFDRLRTRRKREYYSHGQGLTGAAWDGPAAFFVPDVAADPRWSGHLNDSQSHHAFVAAAVPPGVSKLDGLIRIPEGRQHRLLEIDAPMLARFAESAVTPAFDSILTTERLQVIESLEEQFRSHLHTRRQKSPAEPIVTLWDYASKASKQIFDLGHKTVVLYSASEEGIRIEQCVGGLKLVKTCRTGTLIPKSNRSAVGKMLLSREPIVLTNVSQARQQMAYTSVVKGVQSAMVVPLQDGSDVFGAIALTSDRHDLLAVRDLQALILLAGQCSELRQLDGIVTSAEKNAQAQALEATAYQAKNPAFQIHTAGRIIVRDIEEGRQPDTHRLNRLVSSVRHLWMAVDRILYAVENMEPFLRREEMSVAAWSAEVSAIIDEFSQSYFSRKRLKIIFSGSIQSRKCFTADKELLETAVLCLAENAMKASKSRGKVSVKFTLANGMLRISVADRAGGVSPDIRKRIFDAAFRQKYERGLDVVEGAGYGLFVARRIVQAHGGKISIRSDGKSYSSFSISIPVTDQRKGNKS
jgi:signal transduction histidine kinase